MKVMGYRQDGEVWVGALEGRRVRPLARTDRFWDDPGASLAAPAGDEIDVATVEERPAVPTAARVICVGLNYRRHAEESGLPIPTIPVIFSRWARTLSVSGEPAPVVDEKFDWEGELGVVIGRRMFRVTAEQARSGIFGYVAFNDLSARTFQLQVPQWTMGKNSDASGPMTPIVTADEAGDPASGWRIATRVNGRTVQDSTTADMIFPVPDIIAHLSQVMTLDPGDLIITGTPSGVGMASGEFLTPGDTVEVEIEGIGIVTTPIVEAPAATG